MEPLVSVIVPIYGVEKYLERCIKSIVSQDYKNLEIILVDDGSTDQCPYICDQWKQKDERIKVIHKKNGGLSDARNKGIEVCTGKYISFVDSDDYVDPLFISLLYQAIEKTNADIAECETEYVDEEGKCIKVRSAPSVKNMNHMDALRHLIREDGIYQTVWNKLYKRELVENSFFEQGKYNEDEYWTYRVFDQITKLTVVEEPLYKYVQRNTSIMGNQYTFKRLDGLEARFERMLYLQKYTELSDIEQAGYLAASMYHYQCVLRYLNGSEKDKARKQIRESLKGIPYNPNGNLKRTDKTLWLSLFKHFPETTARLRNALKIGL